MRSISNDCHCGSRTTPQDRKYCLKEMQSCAFLVSRALGNTAGLAPNGVMRTVRRASLRDKDWSQIRLRVVWCGKLGWLLRMNELNTTIRCPVLWLHDWNQSESLMEF